MKVLVDTSVWSLAFRKQPRAAAQQVIVRHLTELIKEMRVVMIGPIRQELLSGISDENKFKAGGSTAWLNFPWSLCF